MTRKFNGSQSSNNKKGNNPYSPSSKGSKIQKESKKDNSKNSTSIAKPQSVPSNNLNTKFPPPPVSSTAQSKPLTEAGKNNLAKLANINKMMGVGIDVSAKSVKGTESGVSANSKPLVRKPTFQQVSLALESLKDLQRLLDSYDELEMDQSSNLKSLLEFLEQRSLNCDQKQDRIVE